MSDQVAPPPVDESIDRLVRLVEAWRDGEPAALPVLGSTALRGISLYAHVDHSVRLAKAVVGLAGDGLYIESVPLIRMALECAVTAAWYAVTSDSGDAALAEATRLKRAHVEGIGRASAVDVSVAMSQLDEDRDELITFQSAEARQFEQRCRSLEGGEWLYVVYRDLSGYSHAGALLLDFYLQDDAGPLGFVYTREQDPDRAAYHLGHAVWSLHIALSAWDSLVPEASRTAALAGIAKECGFASMATRVSPVGPRTPTDPQLSN